MFPVINWRISTNVILDWAGQRSAQSYLMTVGRGTGGQKRMFDVCHSARGRETAAVPSFTRTPLTSRPPDSQAGHSLAVWSLWLHSFEFVKIIFFFFTIHTNFQLVILNLEGPVLSDNEKIWDKKKMLKQSSEILIDLVKIDFQYRYWERAAVFHSMPQHGQCMEN